MGRVSVGGDARGTGVGGGGNRGGIEGEGRGGGRGYQERTDTVEFIKTARSRRVILDLSATAY